MSQAGAYRAQRKDFYDQRISINPGESGRGVQANVRAFHEGTNYQTSIKHWMNIVSARMERVVVLNRDWTSCITPTVLGKYRD